MYLVIFTLTFVLKGKWCIG